MGKIRSWYRSVPIWLAIFLYAAAALLLASFVSGEVTGAAYRIMGMLNVEYSVILTEEGSVGYADEGELTYFTATYKSDSDDEDKESSGENGENGSEAKIYRMKVDLDSMSEGDRRRYAASRLIVRISPLLIYSAFLLSAALIFYFTKLKKPLLLLDGATSKIADNDLDFSLDYEGRDEMAKLCLAFEKMRSALDDNSRRMMRMMDEQKELDDAYAHDLRTPIAVLKGYTDMLAKYIPTGQMGKDEVLDTVHTMSAHIARLERFAMSMNTAQRIADLAIIRENVNADGFVSRLRSTSQLMCAGSGISCDVKSEIGAQTLNIDASAVFEVYENLLSNALRFASSRIDVTVADNDGMLSVRVADDGAGFSPKELVSATKPYYSGKQDDDGGQYHLGLGLHICKTLCEKHGGSLTLENANGGGAVVTAKFAV